MSDAPAPQPRPLCDRVIAGIQYIYFLRFSLLLLFAGPGLMLADNGSFNSLTRGFFVPAKSYDFIGEVFFLISAGVIALVTGRLVVLNGKKRFGVEPPPLLAALLGASTDRAAGWMFALYQLPGVCVLAYLLYTSHKENALYPVWAALLMSLVGAGLGLAFWSSLSILYYWTADDRTGIPARTILLPRSAFGMGAHAGERVLQTPRLITRTWNSIARLGAGYAGHHGALYSGHQFAAIAALGFSLVYVALFPLTSPFTSGWGYLLALIAFFIAALYLAIRTFRLNPPSIPRAKYLIGAEFAALAVGSLWLILSYLAPTQFSMLKPAQTFPLLCTVLVLFSLIALLVCALAFFLDRFHIPVLLATLALVFLAHYGTAALYRLPGMGTTRLRGATDHYFNVFAHDTKPRIATPEEVIAGNQCTNLAGGTPCPIIFISATGGGIHAAAWTTEMLTELEAAFQHQSGLADKKYRFHEHVALYSTVSGGSAGLLPFLSEYYATKPFDAEHWNETKQRMVTASACSSLEGVAWGLEYRDFDVFMAPFTSVLFSPEWDRSAALEASMRRHLFQVACEPMLHAQHSSNAAALFQKEGTLAEFADCLYASTHSGSQPQAEHIPAFAMNTTAAETGGRFLLSNYHVPSNAEFDAGVAPAQDFLTAYGARAGRNFFPDIRITTAARLSATFPYVSSAARSDQMEVDAHTLHFVDGGYYDNDGIATVVEFLLSGQSALGSANVPAATPSHAGAKHAAATDTAPATLNLPVLVIEIRDGSDLSTTSPEKDANSPTQTSPPFAWGSKQQLTAPLGAFWSAGHTAVTRRNRRELEVLMKLLESRHVAFQHIVLDYRSPTADSKTQQEASQPLSWSLTPSQMSDLDAAKARVTPCITKAAQWIESALSQRTETPVTGSPAVASCAP